MCAEGGRLYGGVSRLVQGDLGLQALPQMGLSPPISPCLGAHRESDGGSKVEQLRGWSHPLRTGNVGGHTQSDVSVPSWWVFCPVTHSNSYCWVTSVALGSLCGIHWGFWAAPSVLLSVLICVRPSVSEAGDDQAQVDEPFKTTHLCSQTTPPRPVNARTLGGIPLCICKLHLGDELLLFVPRI